MRHLIVCVCISALFLPLATGAPAAPTPQHSTCQLRFDVFPEDTNLTFGGYSTYSTVGNAKFPVTMMDPSTHVGLEGAMYAVLPGPCPDADKEAAWLAAARGLLLTSAPNPYVYQPLEVFPGVLQAGVFGLPLNFSQLQMNLTLAANAQPAATASPAQLPMQLSAVITSGWAFSNSSFTGGAKLDPMRNHTYSGPTVAQVSLVTADNATWLQLSFPRFNTSFAGSSSGTSIDSAGGTGVIHYSLNGTLAMRTRLGCSAYCGDHGRCVRTANGTFGCECECGWAIDPVSGQCGVPNGFCPAFPGEGGGAQVVAAAPASSSCGNGSVVASLRGACPSGYGFDVKTQDCNKCALGFTGPGCNTCQTDLACQDSTSIRGATCATGLAYTERTRSKHYSCAPTSPDIVKVVGPTLAFSCSTVGPGSGTGSASNSATVQSVNSQQLASSTPYCNIELRLGDAPINQTATCTGWGCHFAPNQASFVCDQTVCTCPNGCKSGGQDFEETFRSVTGKFTFDCQADGTTCTLLVGSLNVRIDTTCEASECLDPSGPVLVDSPLPQEPDRRWVHPLVAAVPAMLLCLGLVLCSVLMAAYLKYLRSRPGPAGKGAAGPTAEGSEAHPPDGSPATRRPAISTDDVLTTDAADVDVQCHMQSQAGQGPVALLKENKAHGAQQLLGTHGAVVSQLAFEGVCVRVRARSGMVQRLRRRLCGWRCRQGHPGDVESSEARGDGWKTILHDVSGVACSGSLLGVMGPSGGGKSTLLHVLSGMLPQHSSTWATSGTVSLDGSPASPALLARATALVPQDDCLLRSLTVEECLLYSAALRLDPGLGPGAVRSRVDAVVDALGIGRVRRSTVWSGGGAQGVSGGERRRVSIGMELVSDSPVLVMDEPTSGLDSFAALQLMRQLHSIAATGRIVVLSLHQPGPLLFGLLDTAMLLAAGHVVYYGPPEGAGEGMADLGAPCPPGMPAAEHMLHTAADPEAFALVLPRVQQRNSMQRAHHATKQQQQHSHQHPHHWQHQPEPADATSSSSDSHPPPPIANGALPAVAHSPHPPHQHVRVHSLPLRRQVGILFWRSLADVVRNPALALSHSLTALLLGLLVGVIFLRVANDTAGAQNRVGAMFFALCLLAFTSVTSIDLVQAERSVASRELRRGFYSPTAYVITKLVLDGVILRALPALLFTLPFYFLMGLQPTAAAFFTFLFVFVAFNAAVGALALGFASMLSSAGKTILVMNMVLLLGVLFAGFLANKESIPAALRWICYLSVFRYAWEALVINELSNMFLFFTAPNVKITVAISGDSFLQIIGVDSSMLMADIAVLVALYVACAAFPVAVTWLKFGRRARVPK